MSKRIELDCGVWLLLRDEFTFGDQQSIYRACKVFHRPSGQFFNDELEGAARMVDLLVDEWGVDPVMEPTGENLKKLPAKQSREIMQALKEHVAERVGDDEDLPDASVSL